MRTSQEAIAYVERLFAQAKLALLNFDDLTLAIQLEAAYNIGCYIGSSRGVPYLTENSWPKH